MKLRTNQIIRSFLETTTFALIAVALLSGCGKRNTGKETIQNVGSDTMVNLAQAWAEVYADVAPGISVEVSGGGSGTGIAALINGTAEIANCSRAMKPAEKERALQNTKKTPIKLIVGFDALAVYVHKDNPLAEITLAKLAEIYGEGGETENWSQLGIDPPGGNDEIICISRQSNSGTYVYFREAVLGNKRDFKLGSRDMHGSKDVVELVSKTPGAIGYSGMGYATNEVKMLRISKVEGEASYAPTIENTLTKNYPIARPLFMYSLGEPVGKIKAYLDWCLSKAGQKIVEDSGYVSLSTG
jgi:phosphate transport system substrate-binding protein